MEDEDFRTAATEVGLEASEGSGATPGARLPERYEDLRLLGSGGFGEVRRVYDKKLERVVAMKLIRADVAEAPGLRRRFLSEVKLSAQLHHPGIVALIDQGELDDGRLWFTMPEVRGRTLRAVVEEAFSPAAVGDFRARRRRLVDLFARVCEAMAYAHSRGVIHRDLKPDNIMVGEYGRVMVMDWGLARRVGGPVDAEERSLSSSSSQERASVDVQTQGGEIMGTPAYMSPEQIVGDASLYGPATDVYALGAVLYHLLAGRAPFEGSREMIWKRILTEGPCPVSEVEVPHELSAICKRAMMRSASERYLDAAELAAEIEAFLSGARRREQALAELWTALAEGPVIANLRARAASLREEARALLSPLRSFDPVRDKLPGWSLEDEAERLESEAALAEVRWTQRVHGALAIDPETPEAHRALADHYRDKLAEAERARRHDDAARAEVLLRAHDRGEHAAFLSGKGALTLVTDPPGATVVLERYVLRGRRLVPEILRELGTTPLTELGLDRGSYRLRINAPGCAEVSYPVLIERGEHWDGCAPGQREPLPIVLPRCGEIDDDEVYVPAGWAWVGGDPDAPDSLPAMRAWMDAFVVGRFPITNEQYLSFLNDLVASGKEAEALAACPRVNQGIAGKTGDPLSFERGSDGQFRFKATDVMEVWAPRGPVVLVDWYGAATYARWRSARAGRAFRLLHELEREKAVRGVDGRHFPWGDFFDPTWACMAQSHAGATARTSVDDYPLDESPYGMRGGAGNSRDYCLNRWTLEGPPLQDGRLIIEESTPTEDELCAVRGGAWLTVKNHCRAAARFTNRAIDRRSVVGFRLARTLRRGG